VIRSLFGDGTTTWQLRGGLEELSATQRAIAERVANLSSTSASTDFATTLAAAATQREEEVLRDMAALADTQLRFEAAAKLLQKSYADFRTAIRNHA